MIRIIIITTVFLISMPFLAIGQDNYPTPPKKDNSLFYIQRNHNKNTIIYDAKFDESGNLDKDKPVDAYWIRYEEEGQRLNLRRLERWMVFGVKCKKSPKEGYDYKVNLSASKKISLYLRQTAPFKAEIHMELKGEIFKLEHIYAQLAEGSWMPKPKYAEIYGYSIPNGDSVYKKIDPKEIK